jgi:hypothetical protein
VTSIYWLPKEFAFYCKRDLWKLSTDRVPVVQVITHAENQMSCQNNECIPPCVMVGGPTRSVCRESVIEFGSSGGHRPRVEPTGWLPRQPGEPELGVARSPAFTFPAICLILWRTKFTWTRVVQLFFFPRAKNSFFVGPKGQETPPGTIFKN